MADLDISVMQSNSVGKWTSKVVAPTAGAVLGFNPTTKVPENFTAFTYDSNGHLTWVEGKNVQFGTTTGTKLGTGVSQKIGFWGATPVVQPAGANQAALTDSTTGSVDGVVADVTASHNQAILNNNFADLISRINAIRQALVDAGLIKGAA